MAGKKKVFGTGSSSSSSGHDFTKPPPGWDGNPLPIPDSEAGDLRNIIVGRWLGRGIDSLVWLFANASLDALKGGTITPATALKWWSTAGALLFKYLLSEGVLVAPNELTEQHIHGFHAWLKRQFNTNGSRRSAWSGVKSCLLYAAERAYVKLTHKSFPRNAFPTGEGSSPKAEQPFSKGERERLAGALKRDLIDIQRETFVGLPSDRLVVRTLLLSLRLGANTTPLLTKKRAPLQAHPFERRLAVLDLTKKRGNATHIKSLRYSKEVTGPVLVEANGVAVYNSLMKEAEALSKRATGSQRGRLFLYEKSDRWGVQRGKVGVLTGTALGRGTARFVSRHGLRADDGSALRINLSRFRKSRVLRDLSNAQGDLDKVAAENGHTPAVSERHYLVPDDELFQVGEQALESAQKVFAGEMVPRLEGAATKTPVNGCKDSLHGEHAPKDGQRHCEDFMHCFWCSSFALSLDPEDLWRLFSYRWFLDAFAKRYPSDDLGKTCRDLGDAIERFVRQRVDETTLAVPLERARRKPLSYWAIRAPAEA